MANPDRRPGKRGYQPTPAHVLARAPVFEDYLTGEPIAVPAGTVDWYSRVTGWPMYLNDRIGDCTIAAPGYFLGALSMYAGTSASLPLFSDQAIITAYSAVSGYDPATGANDNGADPRTVCERLHTTPCSARSSTTTRPSSAVAATPSPTPTCAVAPTPSPADADLAVGRPGILLAAG